MLIEICKNTTKEKQIIQPLLATQMVGGKKEMKDRINNIVAYSKQKTIYIVLSLMIAVLAVGCTYGSSAATSDISKNEDSPVSGSSIETEESEESSAVWEDPENFIYNGVHYKEVYTAYAETVDPKEYVFDPVYESEESGVYMSIVNVGIPVLLLSDGGFEDWATESDIYSAHADIYLYYPDEDKVKKIGFINSTGSGYPLIFDGEYIIGGFHHLSKRFKIQDGEAILEEADGFYTDSKEGTHKLGKMSVNGDIIDLSVDETLPIDEIEKLDYYALAGYGKEISFTKVEYAPGTDTSGEVNSDNDGKSLVNFSYNKWGYEFELPINAYKCEIVSEDNNNLQVEYWDKALGKFGNFCRLIISKDRDIKSILKDNDITKDPQKEWEGLTWEAWTSKDEHIYIKYGWENSTYICCWQYEDMNFVLTGMDGDVEEGMSEGGGTSLPKTAISILQSL